MAGRKPPNQPGLWTLLLDKIGLAPQPKKGKKGTGKRKKAGGRPIGGTQRLDVAGGDPALDALVGAPIPEAPEGASPFAQYGQESGMGFADALGYEAAAAAGYAPQMAGAMPAPLPPPIEMPTSGPVFPEPVLPFSKPAPPPVAPLVTPDPGKIFNEAALDSSLDALFSGLEAGIGAPPTSIVDDRPKPRFDEFGLSAPIPVAPTPEPVAAPVQDERPKPPPPIIADAHAVPPAPPTTPPPAPLMAKPATGPLPRSHGPLPAPAKLEIANGVDLKGLMAAIDRSPGVAGSLIVGYDGLVIMSTLPPELDEDYLGAQATSLFAGNGVQSQKMKRGELQRLLLESAEGSMLMTSADMGILVVVSQDGQPMDVAAVLTAIAGALGMG
ncbi:MAG: Roadblock/LC7 family protein [Cyanobacteria bacterium RYN_339]|nr:Roadblock/LC7 family protein [Cyanobacteria bacterium RYN_339]